MNQYQSFIHLSRYARYSDSVRRRETWTETVHRYFDFFDLHVAKNFPHALTWYRSVRPRMEDKVLNMHVMPSMRCLMTAGAALERDNVAGYNCAYMPIEDTRCFDELMYILLCGTGVGYSVEQRYVGMLPRIPAVLEPASTAVVRVEDSKIGWATALREVIAHLYDGRIPVWDTSKVRAKGERLRTFGGRASGPEPLEELFGYVVEVFQFAAGRGLHTIEVHDICCKIADVVVVGGVRRSALLSLSDPDDERMRNAKSGAFYVEHPHRALANNSACYTEQPDVVAFLNEWRHLIKSNSGERGIFNRTVCATRRLPTYRGVELRTDVGTNPCSEIVLRPYQFCNLTEVNVSRTDDQRDLEELVSIATILGTLQSTLLDFRYLRPVWHETTECERLLGVSLTGVMDNPMLSDSTSARSYDLLVALRSETVDTNDEVSKILRVPQSAAITCIKPSGTVSQLVDCSSGIHPRHAKFYIRRVRQSADDPLTRAMIHAGFPHEPDAMDPTRTMVFSFPIKAPHGAVLRGDLSAIRHLELWKMYNDVWCDHKPSITVSVKPGEWVDVGAWVWRHFGALSGVSFLPSHDHVYKQAPYEECTEEAYDALTALIPTKENLNSLLCTYEASDNTTASQELACTGHSCEID